MKTAWRWRTLPSKLLHIDDDYVAYCFDEACAYIAGQIEKKKRPSFPKPESERKRDKTWTTNADVIEDLLKETKQA